MEPATEEFRARAQQALADKRLQTALGGLRGGLVAQRTAARQRLPEFDAYRTTARDIRDRTLAQLDHHLETWERNAVAAGAKVHWAATAESARETVLAICKAAGARTIAKGKSMITEEIGLNAHLEAAGLEVVETDLGEYLVQIRGETPSHIIAPAIHLTPADVEADFRRHHPELPQERVLDTPAAMVAEARHVMRDAFARADVGITGANFLVAETGSSLIVTNEGNGDLAQSLARVHIVVASIDKVVATLADLSVLLRLLARSATGQECTTYTTLSTGPRRGGDPDGPEAYHVVVLDNDRSALLGTELREALRCIRCGACMNHCPVYEAVGGHAYGWVYPGPIGAVMTPAL
ncbi:MAG: putative oxidoreductase subunit with NAD(P)-binding domain and ferridoxin-like domain, partial [Pseudomonadota bacterium]